jgi:hypothetical protein
MTQRSPVGEGEMNDQADDCADAYAAALADLRTAMAVLHACETSLHSEEQRRAARGAASADLQILGAARAALVEAREHVQPAVDEAEAWLRAREWTDLRPGAESGWGRGGA